MMKTVLLTLVVILFISKAKADEGMWVPLYLGQERYQRMSELGSKLSPEDIYSLNQSSLTNAVVLFNGNCTGVVISEEGLLATNHHCAIGIIQSLSTLENNYLENGFWAKTKSDEISSANLKVYFLVRIEDVTSKVLKNAGEGLSENERVQTIRNNINALLSLEATMPNHGYSIKPFFKGNQYLLFEYQIFSDVRLVGTPPLSIGKFGGDTDNWVWPRHTGDFSLFRVYADNNNKPVPFSKSNVPYQPRKVAPISLKGVEEGDFTMILGFPGTTEEYIYSGKAQNILENVYPLRILLRSERLNIIAAEMKKDKNVKLQYEPKYAGIANGWKKWEGAVKGLSKANALEVFKQRESAFLERIQGDTAYAEPQTIMDEFYKANINYSRYYNIKDLIDESVASTEIMQAVAQFYNIFINFPVGDTNRIETRIKRYKTYFRNFYKNYNPNIDRAVFAKLSREYFYRLPDSYKTLYLYKEAAKYRYNFDNWTGTLFNKSVFVDTVKLFGKLTPQKWEKLKEDKAYTFFADYNRVVNAIIPSLTQYDLVMDSLARVYQSMLLKLDTSKKMYPDANLTLRVAFGKVEGYKPADGIAYDYFTTVKGILEKENPDISDYQVYEGLKNKIIQRDYGQYADSTGEMRVCFVASNHTSGGNSGSPIFNANGELVGINFDRCWEGTMSDFLFDPNQCRNISLDVRYMLFIIDKVAGASHLIKEMKLVK